MYVCMFVHTYTYMHTCVLCMESLLSYNACIWPEMSMKGRFHWQNKTNSDTSREVLASGRNGSISLVARHGTQHVGLRLYLADKWLSQVQQTQQADQHSQHFKIKTIAAIAKQVSGTLLKHSSAGGLP